MRIAGIDVPEQKQVRISLTYIYGIGNALALKILEKAGVDGMKKTKDLTEKEITDIRNLIEKSYRIEGDLRREIVSHIKRLKEIKSWRGMKHSRNLPVRGQKTKKNSRTVRGNVRKTVGSGRKDAPGPK